MEYNGQKIPDEFAKEIGNFLGQDFPAITGKFTNLLQQARKYGSPEMIQEIDKGLADLAKVNETVSKIKI